MPNLLQGAVTIANILLHRGSKNSYTHAKGFIPMKIALPKLHTSHPITNEEAVRSCQTALEHKDREDYAGAQVVMRDLWKGIRQSPDISGLHPSVAAEVLLCVGILTSWIGSKNQIKDAQETAKNLITESVTYFESVSDVMKIAAARTEIA